MNPESFSDHFSEGARDYARFRPRYPAALFDWLASLSPRRALAWDCATGSGQAAEELARRFERVIATDASQKQLGQARENPPISYRVAAAETSGLDTESVDLVTVAQALHWLDLPRFYEEVRRVLADEGVIAVWSYQLASVDEPVDRVIRRFYGEVVGAYWPPERALVERGYEELPFPFAEIPAPRFAMEESWDLSHWIGYMGTWSAVTRYRNSIGADPIDLVRSDLEHAWTDPAAARTVRWPLQLRVGRKSSLATDAAVL